VERIDKDQQYSRNNNNMIQYAPSWITVGSNTICAMTGLALDVEHLCRVLQKFADDHYNIYQTSLSTHVMTQRLAKLLQNACLFQGARPFGVQAMLIGCDDDIDRDNNDGLCIYSMDPSGSWQSWGRATAIGKYGREARKILSKKLQSSSSSSSNMNLQDAVECLAECWKETCRQQNIAASNNAKEDCQVLILRKDPKESTKSHLYRVPSEEMNRILEKVDNKLAEKEA
jgi:20S proteasome alpha/beta subunit